MLYYSAQRYDPQLRQQQPTLLPTTPLVLLGHLSTSFTAHRIIYPASVFSRFAPSRSGTPSLLIRDGSTTSSSNRGSSSRWHDEYSGRISALTNATIFESDETSLNSFAGDNPASVKEPDPGEKQTPSIESMLSAMRLEERAITPPPSSDIRHHDDTIGETDQDEEIFKQVPSVSKIPDLAQGTSDSPSNILDQHPEYDSVYDYSEKSETISDFFVGQDPDDHVNDTCSFGQSIGISDIQASVSPNHPNNVSLPTRPPSAASSSTSSIRFRTIDSSTPQATIPPTWAQVTFGRPSSFNPNDTVVPSRRITFADPESVPSLPISRAQKAVAWWKIRLHRQSSNQPHPESTKPDAPSQPISPPANSIATSDENVETHPRQPPPLPRSPAPSIRHRRTRINLRRVVSAILPCIPISQESDESGKAESKEKPRSNGIFPIPLGRRWRKNKNKTQKARDMAEVKTLQA